MIDINRMINSKALWNGAQVSFVGNNYLGPIFGSSHRGSKT